MEKRTVKKWLAGIILMLVCLMAVPVCAKAASPDRRTYKGDGISLQFTKKTSSMWYVTLTLQGQKDKLVLKWYPKVSSGAYTGKVTGYTIAGYEDYKWISTSNSSLWIKDRNNSNRADCKMILDGGKEAGYVVDVTPFKITGTKTLWTSGGSKSTVLKANYGGRNVKAKWTSSKKSVATVNGSGKVTAKKSGKTVITAKVNGRTVKYTITVKKPTIKLNKKKAVVKAGTVYKLTAKVTGPSKKVTWISSKSSVAKVDANGRIVTKKKGTAKITAKANGVKATFTIKVK